MLKLLSAFIGGLLLCACSAQAVDASKNPLAIDEVPASAGPVADAYVYQQHCGICHLDAGQGVPGAFPPLDQRLAGWSGSDAGQAYLASVLANGLYGVIEINGQRYAGAMPGLAGQLSNFEIAGLLNYVLVEFAGGAAVFTESSVAASLDAVGAGPSLPLRPQ